MTTQVAKRTQLVTFAGVPASAIALQLPKELTFEKWAEIGQLVVRVANASAWWIGDWASRGQWDFGTKYREVIEATGLDYQTIKNYAWVCGKFDWSRRRDQLSFGHHAIVAALPQREQDSWLDLAERETLSVRALQAAVAGARSVSGGDAPELERLTLAFEPARLEKWQHAAEAAGLRFDEWAAAALDAAAGESA